MRRTLLSRLTVLALLLAALPGCTRPADKGGTVKGPTSGSGKGETKVAFVSNNAFDFWTIAEKGTEKAGKDLGVQVVFRKPAQGSAEEQQNIIEDLLNTGIQGIAVSPNDSANSVDFYRKVYDKVPLIMTDSDLPDPKARRCYLGTHNYRAGLAVGKLVTEAVPDGGKIAIFVGALDVQNAIERRQGVLDYLSDPGTKKTDMGEKTPEGASNVKVGKYTLVVTQTDNRNEATCQERAQDILQRTPDLACLVGLWEYNPPALLRAVESAKLKKPPVIVGFDENYQTLDGIKTGAVYATVVQNPFEFGYQSVKILKAFAAGDDKVLKSYEGIDADNRIFIPHRVVNKANVEEFYTELKKLKGK